MECPLSSAAAAMVAEGIGLTITDAFNIPPSRDRIVLRPFEARITTDYRVVWNEGVQATFDRPRLATLLQTQAQATLRSMKPPLTV
jgi:hypothetical protein